MKKVIKKIIIICITFCLPICCLSCINKSSNNAAAVNTQINKNVVNKPTEQLKNDIEAEVQSDTNVVNKPIDSSIKNIDIKGIIETLCSDKFEGREVGTKGNEYAVDYMVQTFKELKLDFVFKNSYLHEFELGYENKKANNVIGKIASKNPKNAVVVSAHLDHIGIRDGKFYRGALDNASGIAGLVEIASLLKEKSEKNPFDFDIIICAFNSEEGPLLAGSKAFVKDIKSEYSKLYNINIDCIGAVDGGKIALKNISRIAGYSDKLYEDMRNIMEKNKIEFSNNAVSEKAFINDVGIGDHASFERAGIPNIYIGDENTKALVHKTTDVPEILDFDKIRKIADAIAEFIETKSSGIFKYKASKN